MEHLNETQVTQTMLMTLCGDPESIESTLISDLHQLVSRAVVCLKIASRIWFKPYSSLHLFEQFGPCVIINHRGYYRECAGT